MCVYVTIWQSDWPTVSPFAACHESQLLLAEVPFALVNYWGAGISNRMKLHTQLPLPPAGWFTSSFALNSYPWASSLRNINKYLKLEAEGLEGFFTGQILCIVALICWYLMVAKEAQISAKCHVFDSTRICMDMASNNYGHKIPQEKMYFHWLISHINHTWISDPSIIINGSLHGLNLCFITLFQSNHLYNID